MHMLRYRYAVGVVDDNVMVCCSFFVFVVFGENVAVGAGAGYSIELGVEALSGLSEVMILANLMSRLTWPKKTAAKLQRLQGPCRVSLRAKLQDLLRGQGLEENHELGDTTRSPSCSSSEPRKTRKTGKANQTQTQPISEMLKCRCMDLAQHA